MATTSSRRALAGRQQHGAGASRCATHPVAVDEQGDGCGGQVGGGVVRHPHHVHVGLPGGQESQRQAGLGGSVDSSMPSAGTVRWPPIMQLATQASGKVVKCSLPCGAPPAAPLRGRPRRRRFRAAKCRRCPPGRQQIPAPSDQQSPGGKPGCCSSQKVPSMVRWKREAGTAHRMEPTVRQPRRTLTAATAVEST